MIYRVMGAPGERHNDFTSAARAFLFVLLRPGVRAGVVASSREKRIHYVDRAPPRSAISLSFLQRVPRQNDRAASICTTCCARYLAKRAAGSSPCRVLHKSDLASARNAAEFRRMTRRVIHRAEIISLDDRTIGPVQPYGYRPFNQLEITIKIFIRSIGIIAIAR